MENREREVLVLLREEGAEATVRLLRSRFGVSQEAPPRLAILRVQERKVQEVKALPGVEAAFEGAVPASVLEALTPGEALFAKAWAERHQMVSKVRPGEGLPWDAEGFRPPGTPQSSSQEA